MRLAAPLLLLVTLSQPLWAQAQRPRARDVGLVIGVLPPGPLDAITDVAGVRVGEVTVTSGDSINTGVTAILPHGGNVLQEKVPAAVAVGNGFGKLTGIAPIRELGELESPDVLTCTLCVPRVADAVLTWILRLARRAILGVSRTGSPMTDGTGDFAIACSTAAAVRRGPLSPGVLTRREERVAGEAVSPLFEAVVEATEEAVVNSLFRAETVQAYRGTVTALPMDSVLTILREHRVIP